MKIISPLVCSAWARRAINNRELCNNRSKTGLILVNHRLRHSLYQRQGGATESKLRAWGRAPVGLQVRAVSGSGNQLQTPTWPSQNTNHGHGGKTVDKLTSRLKPWSLPHIRQHESLALTRRKERSYSSFVVAEDDPQQIFAFKSFEDHLFDALGEDNDCISLPRFLNDLKATGLRLDDPRLRESMQKFSNIKKVLQGQDIRQAMMLDRAAFKECVKDNAVLIHRAFTNDFVIPDFPDYCEMLDKMYWGCKPTMEGKVADYIPQLARFSSDNWGVSVCTVDGQRHSIGETVSPFCLQSCSKPLTYALVLHELGPDVVHQYVGQEPSGEVFNEIKLDHKGSSSRNQRFGKPHNPMINAGAIVVTSLVKNDLKLADRFDYVSNHYKRLAGGEYLGFNNAVFLSERETADRNFALGYYMKENRCFPDGTHLMETLDFYFQLCSIEVTCESGAVMAATLANGGICPITGTRVLGAAAVRNTLSLMYSCGMYDYSGQFAFTVGLPAKSGVSGAILLVVPNVMGVCLWSPPLDETGNSVRGIQFCKDLVNTFNFHNYDNLKYTPQKTDPRVRKVDQKGLEIMTLLFGASNGDLTALRRLACMGINMGMADYDGRTALHLAAAEGHVECINFLLDKCHVDPNPLDRWQQTPLDDAKSFNHEEIVAILSKYKKEESSEVEKPETEE